MSDYRVYPLDGRGQISGAAEVLAAVDDKQAIAAARAQNCRHGCEVWQRNRLVARVEPPK